MARESQALLLDESMQDDVLTVGGYIVPVARLEDVIDGWRDLKEHTFGIDPHLELKYSLPGDHPARDALEANGWTHAKRVSEMLRRIAKLDVTVLADTLIHARKGGGPVDFYPRALAWCARRLANQVGQVGGPHLVICDMPPDPSESSELYGGKAAAFDRYEELYWKPEKFEKRTAPSLRSRRFVSTLLAAHAKHTDLLQVADVITGCIRKFCHYNLKKASGQGKLPPVGYPDENMQIIASNLRRGPRVKGYGFDVFPKDDPACDEIIKCIEALADPRDWVVD